MADLSVLTSALGAQPVKPTKFTPLSTQCFFTGLFTQRSPFHSPDNRYNSRFLGGRQDILSAGLNLELTNAATIIRRPGTIPYSNWTLDGPILGFYSFKQIKNIANPIDVIADTFNSVFNITPTTATKILDKATGAGQSSFLGVGNTLYIGDGVDLLAWVDGQTTRNWGISIGPFSGESGPNQAAAAVDTAVTGGTAWADPDYVTVTGEPFSGTVETSGSSVTWQSGEQFNTDGSWNGKIITIATFPNTVLSVSSPTVMTLTANASGGPYASPVNYSINGTGYATATLGPSAYSNQGPNLPGQATQDASGASWSSPANLEVANSPTNVILTTSGKSSYLTASGFNFSVPTNATITGLEVSYTRAKLTGSSAINGSISLTGVIGSPTVQVDNGWPGTLTPLTVGFSAYLWGLTTLTPAIVNSSSFGALIQAQATGAPGNGGTGSVENVYMKVYYSTPTTGVTDLLAASQFSLNFSSQTSLFTGTVSTAGTAVSLLTGALFVTDGSWNNQNITIGSSVYVVASVSSTTSLTLLTDAGINASESYAITTTAQSISGIQVSITGHQDAVNDAGSSFSVQLMKNGVVVGTPKTGLQLQATTDATLLLGASNDLWGTTWSASDISATNFGVAIQGHNPGTSASWAINNVSVAVWGTGGPPISVVGVGLGAFSAVTGYQYVVAYGNSGSGAVSSTTPISASTGPFNNAQYVGIGVTASTDPQVNQIWVFRTLDGGTTPLALPGSPYPNVTTIIQDNSPDSDLSITQPAPLAPSNNPPPAGLRLMAYHMSRVWGAVGNVVYYSGGPDVLVGNGSEAFPPANSFTFPTKVNFLLPAAAGLLVFTQDDIWIINGTSTATFYPSLYLPGVGLLSQNAVDDQGNFVFLYSSDRQFVTISSSGLSEIGFGIGDILETTYDPTKVYVASLIAGTSDKAVFIANGTDSWYRCNWNQPPEGGPAWSPQATIQAGFTAMSRIETSPGHYVLMIGRTDRTVAIRAPLLRDPATGQVSSTFTDNGIAYPAFMTLGSLVLAQPSQIAEVQSVTTELRNVGTIPSISVALDEITPGNIIVPATFELLPLSVDDPPILPTSESVMSKRFYLDQAQDSILCRHMQIQINFVAEAQPTELLTLSVYGSLLGKE